MIDGVITLFKTLIEIIFLRKGPADIPYSPVLLVIVATLWLTAGVIVIASIDILSMTDFVVSLTTAALALTVYSAVLFFLNKKMRLLQTLTAILGCGAVLEMFFVGSHAVLGSLVDKNVAALISYLVLLWSVPVEGHIIARATDRHWYFGFLIAFTVFLLQIELSSFINPVEQLSP